MTIACLGWGSLIWCQKELPVDGAWNTDGPSLPIEYARQSNDNRITLVITPDAPLVQTLWATLSVDTIEDAKAVLADREGISVANIKHSIGMWSAGVGDGPQHDIDDWAMRKGISHVVWTALKPKIRSEYRTPSTAEVLTHLAGLVGPDRDRAEEYVRMTPRQIATPRRAEIEQVFGWTPLSLV
jgi:hypothetical protein